MRRRFSGRRTLILGGSCRLALGLAAALPAQGLYPIPTYRSDAGKGRIEKAFHSGMGEFTALYLDLCRKETIEEVLAPVLEEGVDYMVDFAQGDLEGLVASADTDAVSSFFESNIASRAAVIRRVSRAMVLQGAGRMVYVSSTAAGMPNPGQGFYAAAKQASEALYRSAGLELAPRGVTTVALRPGYVNAGRGNRYLNKNADVALAKVPLGRALQIAEVVDTILFLLSDSAVGFNATALTMDGGLSAGK